MIIIRSRTILARRKFPLNSGLGGRNRRFEMNVDNNIGSDMKILRFVNFFFFVFLGWLEFWRNFGLRISENFETRNATMMHEL